MINTKFFSNVLLLSAAVCIGMTACSRKIVSWNGEIITEKMFHEYLRIQDISADELRSNKEKYFSELTAWLSIKAIYIEASNSGFIPDTDTVRRIKETIYIKKKKYAFSSAVDAVRILPQDYEDFSTVYDIQLFYIDHLNYIPYGTDPELDKKTDAIHSALQSRRPFYAVANRFSDLADTHKGGLRIFSNLSSIAPPIRTELDKLSQEEFSRPFVSDSNIIIIQKAWSAASESPAATAYREIRFSVHAPSEFSNQLQKSRAVYREIKSGLDFSTAANKYTDDPENFSGSTVVSVDLFSKYFMLVPFLKKAKTGDILEQIPMGTGYVYIHYLKKKEPSADELHAKKKDAHYFQKMLRQKKRITVYNFKKTIHTFPEIRRNYNLLFINKDMRDAHIIASYGEYDFTFREITNILFSGKEESFVNNLLRQPHRFASLIEYSFLLPRIFEIFINVYYDYIFLKKKIHNIEKKYIADAYVQHLRNLYNPAVPESAISNYYEKVKIPRFQLSYDAPGKLLFRPLSSVSNQIRNAILHEKRTQWEEEYNKNLLRSHNVIIFSNLQVLKSF